jgi:H+/Cl- antiporter ClcA
MDRQRRHRLKQALLALSVVWLTIGTWVLFVTIPADEVQTMHSSAVKDRMRDECTGNFRDRYQCKENIVLEVSQDAFANLALRTVLLISVPLLLAIGYNTLWRVAPEPHRPHFAAVVHETHPAKHADHHPPVSHASPAPPAAPPVDDWKSRAKQHISQSTAPPER